MSKEVFINVRNTKISASTPVICIPIVAGTKKEILEQCREITKHKAQIVEWRIDFWEGLRESGAVIGNIPGANTPGNGSSFSKDLNSRVNDRDVLEQKSLNNLSDVLNKMRLILGDLPLICTVRTKDEGGEINFNTEEYFAFYKKLLAANDNYFDFIDFELAKFKKYNLGDESERDILPVNNSFTGSGFSMLDACRKKNVKTIFSYHNFDRTPDKNFLYEKLCEMEKCSADIAKIAVMPQSANDITTLFEATDKAYAKLNIPIITMSMGKLGEVSRTHGHLHGSCLTFGCLAKASAPGQINADELFDILHG